MSNPDPYKAPPPFEDDELETGDDGMAEAEAAFRKVTGQEPRAKKIQPEAAREPEEAEEEDPFDEEEDEDAEAEEEGEEEKEESPADKARKALALRKVPKESLARISDEDVQAIWAGLEQRELEHDRKLQEASSKRDGSKGKATEKDALKALLPDLHQALDDLADTTGDDELAGKLRGGMEALAREVVATKQMVEARNAQERNAALQAARSDLRESLPDLKDDALFKRVSQRMALLARDPDFQHKEVTEESVKELMLAAARSLGIGPPERRTAPKGPGPQRKPKTAATRSTTDTLRTVYDHLRRNPGDVHGAQRVAGLS